jgi:hypothetical protein
MPGVELSTSACHGHVVVILRGDLRLYWRGGPWSGDETFEKRDDHWIAKRDPRD